MTINAEPLCQDKTGRLDHNAFKSCLRALGYDLPMVEEPEPEFEAILNVVDPNRYNVAYHLLSNLTFKLYIQKIYLTCKRKLLSLMFEEGGA